MSNPIISPKHRAWAFGLAHQVARRSKDPTTKVGAVIFDPEGRVISTGYNGFARGVQDTQERLENRELKYKLTLHAEMNALLFANQPLRGCTLVTTHPCCAQCAAAVKVIRNLVLVRYCPFGTLL